MRRILVGTLFVVMLLGPLIAVFPLSNTPTENPTENPIDSTERKLNLDALTEEFGDSIPVAVKFSRPLFLSEVEQVESHGLRFSLGSAEQSRVGSFYSIRGPREGIEFLLNHDLCMDIAPINHDTRYLSPRDVSIPEIEADRIWNSFDGLGRNITGEGILIADLDTGVDWKHPDLWYADGEEYDWIDDDATFIVQNISDSIDLDSNGTASPDEQIRFIDIDDDGAFDATTEWIWADNITQDGIYEFGEPFFVVNDTNTNGFLDSGEKLVMLTTPKTRYIVELDGTGSPSLQVWERGVNLTNSDHTDINGHGTSVSGILLGGQIGFRDYVGVAPAAELMMIRVLGGPTNTNLQPYDALLYASTHGADVILLEFGQWVSVFMDGSSMEEQLIDQIVSNGIPVIGASGNLGGSDKHAMALVTGPSNPFHRVDFNVPGTGPEDIWITILSINNTDFTAGTFSIDVSGGGTVVLTPNYGHENWGTNNDPISGAIFNSYVLTSSRGTKMMHIVISNTIPTGIWTLNISLTTNATIHCYVSDSDSGWSGGVVWTTDFTNDHLIVFPTTSDSTLAVASYHTRSIYGIVGAIASYSSIGPRIDGLQKQGIAAPGGWDVISDFSNESTWASWYNASGSLPLNPRFGGYQLFSGTSAAAPHAAGCAALMLQVNSSIGSQVNTIIKASGRVDSDTGAVPNPTWGSGKLDVYTAVLSVPPTGPDVDGPFIDSPEREPVAPESLDTVEISVTVIDPSGVDAVILEYNNGTHWNNITMVWNTTHFVATIPSLPNGTHVVYRIHSNDTLNNWATTPNYSYDVLDTVTTTTTTTTTTTNTTTTTITITETTTSTETETTSTTTTNTGYIPPDSPDYLFISIALSMILVLVIFSMAFNRRQR